MNKSVNEMPKMKPTLYLSSDDCPEIKQWEVGKTYELSMKVKQVGMSMGENKNMSATFAIIKVRPEEKKDEKYPKEIVKKAIGMIR